MAELSQLNCVPCKGAGASLNEPQAREYLKATPGWQMKNDGKSISICLEMKNFLSAVDLINKITEVSEENGHHPDLHLTGYQKLTIELTTHAIGGLSKNDFILAAKINKLDKLLKVKTKHDNVEN